MSFKDHFSSHAAAYADYRPSDPPALAAWLADIALTTELALDTGTGSGQLSLLLAGHFDKVVATEPSAEQVERATRHPRIDYRIARAEQCDLPDASVDLLTAAQAAHWFDLPAFFVEAKRPLVAMIGYLDTWSAIRAMKRAIDRGPFDIFLTELAEIWGDPETVRTIRWPLAIRAGRA